MDHLTSAAVAVALAIVGLATVAVLVSRNANTSGVIGASASGFSQALAVAESPVTGGGFNSFSFGGMTGVGSPIG